ncbi:hypothetical protein A2U01_0100420 [Trifolium medium]|uniref:Uncharacterized protein n=1 Tax=Trifolium medium TaxID=97028 RepID=A0A392UVY1_9FABA|nr:hypothetical protein [Trifolium medium]
MVHHSRYGSPRFEEFSVDGSATTPVTTLSDDGAATTLRSNDLRFLIHSCKV